MLISMQTLAMFQLDGIKSVTVKHGKVIGQLVLTIKKMTLLSTADTYTYAMMATLRQLLLN